MFSPAVRLADLARFAAKQDSNLPRFMYVLILSWFSYAMAISLCLCVMVITSRAPIEWCIGEPMPVFFYNITSIILIY